MIKFAATTFILMPFTSKTIVIIAICWFFASLSFQVSAQEQVVFSDNFDDNRNNWDLFESKLSNSDISAGRFKLISNTTKGTSRFLNVESNFENFNISTTLIKSGSEKEASSGLLIGFKDWDNYLYFTTSYKYFSIGYFENGEQKVMSDMSYSSDLASSETVGLRVETNKDYFVFYINDVIHFKMRKVELRGKGIGFLIANKPDEVSFDELVMKSGTGFDALTIKDVKSSGSGFIISSNGHIITNHHVIEGASKLTAEIVRNEVRKDYKLTLIASDPANDLAVLRIEDTTLTIPAVPFSLKSGNLDLGASIYTLGFPLFLSGLGNEPKFTDGKVSSKTGFNNAVNSYQTNLGVQPGNSGGPVFNTKGELVGVVSAKITNADNVSYAVKTSYLQLLLEGSNVDVPTKNTLAELSLEEQLKRITEYVVLIKAY